MNFRPQMWGACVAIAMLASNVVYAQVGVSPVRSFGINTYQPHGVLAPTGYPPLVVNSPAIAQVQGTQPIVTPAPVVTGPAPQFNGQVQGQVITQPPVITNPPGGFDPYYSEQQNIYPPTGTAAPGFLPQVVTPTGPAFPSGLNWNGAASGGGVITPRVGGGHFIGEDVGLNDNYTWIHGIAPLTQTPGVSILFADVRAISYNDSRDDVGANAALGYRSLNPTTNRIFGGYGGVDYHDFGAVDFTQLTAGLESLGRLWDFRGNLYIVVSDDDELTGFQNVFVGTNVRRDPVFLEALDGFDVEAGRNLFPDSPTMDLRLFGGFYGFYADNSDYYGLRGRVEGRLWNGVFAEASLQHDDLSDTTLNFSLSFLIGGGRFCNACGNHGIAERLGDPIYKIQHIVIQNRQDAGTLLNAFDANGNDTGVPLEIAHVGNTTFAGEDGSINNPYDSLADAEADANADIILLQADTTFTGESITLDANQRLLGDFAGAAHIIPSQFGNTTLPRSSGGTARPIILDPGAATDAVTLANNNEVSGLDIRLLANGDNAIEGTAISGFEIDQNLITATNAGSQAIVVTGADEGFITNNTMTADQDVINVTQAGANLELTITGNTGTSNNDDFLEFDSPTVGVGTILVSGNTIGAADVGVMISADGTSTVNSTVTNNGILATGDSIDLNVDLATATMNADVRGNFGATALVAPTGDIDVNRIVGGTFNVRAANEANLEALNNGVNADVDAGVTFDPNLFVPTP